MTTTQAKRTHCQNCGMKLPEQPLSLCAYCAMPLDLGAASPADGDGSVGEGPNAARIGRILEHDKYAETMALEPSEGPEYWEGLRVAWRGKFLAATGIAVLLLVALFGAGAERSFFTNPGTFLGLAILATGIYFVVKGGKLSQLAIAAPLLKRAGLITDRRSETAVHGYSGATSYYFTVEFADGVTGEFTYPGRGAHEDPYSTNLPGVAFTRGPMLISFKHIRV
ncbi:MAG: hypothetical protein ACI8QZ_002772 [Chlamydiales bacterium]|jgi:hypothetical protein